MVLISIPVVSIKGFPNDDNAEKASVVNHFNFKLFRLILFRLFLEIGVFFPITQLHSPKVSTWLCRGNVLNPADLKVLSIQ